MAVAFLLLILLSTTCCADPIELEKSTSPNAKFYLTIAPSTDDHMLTSDILQIRQSKDKKIVATFEWGQFGPHISPTSAKALWKPDNQAFALTTYVTRGWTQSTVYACNGTKWVELTEPKFTTKYSVKEGWESRGKGHFIAVKWVGSDVLKIDYCESLLKRGVGNSPADSEVNDEWVYLRLHRNAQGPSLDVWSVDEKIMVKADAAN